MKASADHSGRIGPWLVVAVCFLVLSLSFSARGSLALAMPTWQAEFGWSRSFLSGTAACAMLLMALIAPFAGNSVDRYGPRTLLCLGLGLLALAMFGVASVTDGSRSWLFILAFGVAGGSAFGIMAQHVVVAAIAMNFSRNRGLATGIATSGSTAGQLMLLPLLALLLQAGEWRSGYLGLSFLALACIPVAYIVLRPMQQRKEVLKGAALETPEKLGGKLWRMATSPAFQILFWTFFVCGFTTSGVIETHLLPYAAFCGFPPLPSATAYGLLSGINLAGMVLAGWLTDRLHRPLLLAGIYFARALCFLLLTYIGDSYSLLLTFAVLFGLFDYSTVPVTASLLASRLGIGMLGLSMGVLSAGHAVGGALGAYAGGWLFDRTGRYDALWFSSVSLALGAALLAASLKEDRRGRLTETAAA